MKYEFKCPTKKSVQRKWFKRTLKRSERFIQQKEVQNQVEEVLLSRVHG